MGFPWFEVSRRESNFISHVCSKSAECGGKSTLEFLLRWSFTCAKTFSQLLCTRKLTLEFLVTQDFNVGDFYIGFILIIGGFQVHL